MMHGNTDQLILYNTMDINEQAKDWATRNPRAMIIPQPNCIRFIFSTGDVVRYFLIHPMDGKFRLEYTQRDAKMNQIANLVCKVLDKGISDILDSLLTACKNIYEPEKIVSPPCIRRIDYGNVLDVNHIYTDFSSY